LRNVCVLVSASPSRLHAGFHRPACNKPTSAPLEIPVRALAWLQILTGPRAQSVLIVLNGDVRDV